MSTARDVEVFVSDPVEVDPDCFQLYLNGIPVEEAAVLMTPPGTAPELGDLHLRYCEDQWRAFHMIEPYLGDIATNAGTPNAQGVAVRFEDDPSVPACKLQLTPGVLALLRARYYEFDDAVMRSFLGGRKLTTKQVTKELGEIAQRTRVSFRSCRRQLENLRRVYRHAAACQADTDLMLAPTLGLPVSLARRYMLIVFLVTHRFELGKRRLQHLDLRRLEALAESAREFLCVRRPRRVFPVSVRANLAASVAASATLAAPAIGHVNQGNTAVPAGEDVTWAAADAGGVTIQQGIIDTLSIIGSKLTTRPVIEEYAAKTRGNTDQVKLAKVKWRDLVRSLGALALSVRGKRSEFREFFLSINDRVVEPLSQASLYTDGLQREDLARLFSTLANTYESLTTVPAGMRSDSAAPVWRGFLRVIETVTAVIMFK